MPGTFSLAVSWWSKMASGSGRPGAGASSSAKPTPGDSPDAGAHRRRPAPLQRGPRADYAGESYLEHLQLHRPVVLHVDGGHHLHAGLFADCRGHELEAGALHHPAGQPDRARAHALECARRRQVRDSLPRLRARQLRRPGREYSRDAARPGGVRMVRHSVLVRRPGDRRDDRRGMAGDGA